MTNSYPCGSTECCTGCGACAAVCPVSCISMAADDEGFLCPAMDAERCTDCGLCTKICPVAAKKIENADSEDSKPKPLAVYAAWHLDDAVRRASSSGGVFTALAEHILAQGGVVIGAAFDEQLVVRHILVDSPAQLHRLRGSKYVQSEIAPGLYRQIEGLLKQGRPVLFSGTPCQVAGLRGFLRKPYENLYCCDTVCMGVPSSKLLKKYIDWKCAKTHKQLISCEFRNKVYGWQTPSMAFEFSDNKISYERSGQNPYFLAFGMRIALRSACYACRFKGVSRTGDLTIADFWGVGDKYPEYDCDDKGTSLLLVNNQRAKAWLDACRLNLFLGVADIETAIAGNPMCVKSSMRPSQRDMFYINLNKCSFPSLIRKYGLRPPSLLCCIRSGIKRRLSDIRLRGMCLLGLNKRTQV